MEGADGHKINLFCARNKSMTSKVKTYRLALYEKKFPFIKIFQLCPLLLIMYENYDLTFFSAYRIYFIKTESNLD